VTREVQHEDPARAREHRSHWKPSAVRVTEPVQENERASGSEFGPVKIDLSHASERAAGDAGG
jgi:hypothetical protein